MFWSIIPLIKHHVIRHSPLVVTGQTPQLNDSLLSHEERAAKREWERQKPLSERLKVAAGEALDLIPAQLLRKYVAYARKYVHPKITPECAQVRVKRYMFIHVDPCTYEL